MAENVNSFLSLTNAGPLSSGPDSSLSLGDEDPKFVHESDQVRFQCPVHKGMLREACQTPCGHRICAGCVAPWLNGASSKQCPVGESDCIDITPDTIFPDRSIRREMKTVPVECRNKNAGCNIQPPLKNLLKHLEECEFESIPCTYSLRGCKEKVLRGNLKKHKDECPFRPVSCKLCSEEVNWNTLQNHLEEKCPEKVTGCPYGCDNKELKRKEVLDHRNVCPVHPIYCNFQHMGCKFEGKREVVRKHEKDDLAQHLELVTQHVAQLQLNSLDTQENLRVLAAERDELQKSMQSSRGQDQGFAEQVLRIETQIRDFKLKLVTAMEKMITIERKIPDMVERPRVEAIEQNLRGLQHRITEVEQRQEREQRQQTAGGSSAVLGGRATIGQHENMTDDIPARLMAHDQQLGVQDVRLGEIDLRFQLLETTSYDGTLIWKIRDYRRRKTDAINGRTLSLYSQPFYSHRFGYKMCARIYLNGDGMGKGSHLSLFFVVMRGEYDSILNWPFRQKVTLTLLDQSPQKRHLTDHFQPDAVSTSFQRPTAEMNVASGCPLFVSHTVLESEANGYRKDDTIFIRIIVEPTHIPVPSSQSRTGGN